MRKIIYILILSFLFLFESQASLLEDRGFKSGECYRHLVQLSTKRSQCLVDLFPESRAQLSLPISGCPKTLPASKWQTAIFKTSAVKKNLQITLLKSYAVDTDIAELQVQNEQGLAQLVKCPSK